VKRVGEIIANLLFQIDFRQALFNRSINFRIILIIRILILRKVIIRPRKRKLAQVYNVTTNYDTLSN